ncbi:hypothetical protein M422DRAFT_244978 [Sphaerobolus stellatus SS14]|nr:hypothetical protein M422DRAFT_244978 [Sphaerobolus stellatus SS14]
MNLLMLSSQGMPLRTILVVGWFFLHVILAVCHKYIKPKWFVTATTNPAWKEITDELLPGQTPSDRPDLDGVLGKITAFVSHIEFQKCGLPHEHSLYFGSPDDPIRSPEDVGKESFGTWLPGS